MRRYAVSIVLGALATVLLAAGLICLRYGGLVAMATGHGAVTHLEAFGSPPDRIEAAAAWHSASRLLWWGWLLLGSSLALVIVAVLRWRSALVTRADDAAGARSTK
jgi:hypothetical protein